MKKRGHSVKKRGHSAYFVEDVECLLVFLQDGGSRGTRSTLRGFVESGCDVAHVELINRECEALIHPRSITCPPTALDSASARIASRPPEPSFCQVAPVAAR